MTAGGGTGTQGPAGLPRSTGTLVVGAGTAGSAVAGLLAAADRGPVLLVEAGPDHGPLAAGRWPDELLDASQLPLTDDWGLTTSTGPDRPPLALERARVVGGCSAHNGCQLVLGHRRDYDDWSAAGNPGWSAAELEPFVEAALRRLRARGYADDEITPFQRLSLEAMAAVGLPRIADLNDLDGSLGAAPTAVNIVDGVRWNSAFAYLDPVRDRPTLTVVGGVLCERLLLEADRVVGAILLVDGLRHELRAERVVLAAGAYGTPCILQRSGVGDEQVLARAGVALRHRLPGVGANLQDHPAIELRYRGSRELEARSRAFAATTFHPEEQVVAKARSSRCEGPFDLHVYTQGGARRANPDEFVWEYMAGVLETRSRGRVAIVSPDAERPPHVDHAFLADPDGEDLARLVEGFELLREIGGREGARPLLGPETLPGAHVRGPAAIREAVHRGVVHAYHPGGTCKMGPARDPDAVVDATGAVHGLTGLYVADASLMPVLPRANTNLPTAVVAERIASLLLDPHASRPATLPEEALR